MRARTTWNTDQILQRTSATNRVADPYAMNQDHLKPQPPADKYLTGDPSAFAEDITTPDTWKVEYAGGAVKRNEIGLPENRPETFNHPEKTASDINHEAILKKAHIATQIARRMLSADATEIAIEQQAASLMHLPDQHIVETYNRLAGEMPPALKKHLEEKEQGGQQAAKKEEANQEQAEQEQAKQAAAALQRGDTRGFQAALSNLADLRNKKRANDPQQAPMQQQAQGQQQGQPVQQQAGQQQAPAQQQAGQQQQSAQDQQSAWYDSKGQRPGHSGPDTGPHAGQQQQAPVQQQAGGMGQQQGLPPGQAAQQQMPVQQAQQQMPVQQAQQQQMPQMAQGQQQNIEAEVQQMIQQAAQQLDKQANAQLAVAPVQQAPAQQVQVQQVPVQPVAQVQQAPAQVQASVVVSDDQLIDQMLQGPGGAAPSGAPIAEMEIQMEAPNMDIGDVTFEPGEDAMLRQLFANGDEAQAAQQAQDAQQGQGQQHQANVRTAALRTIGTRPGGGVARIGGAGAPPGRGQEVDKLTSLWQSAPDVREAFGLKTNS